MTNPLLQFGSGATFERLEKLTRRAKDLPIEAREMVEELLEAFSVSVEELQVSAEELNQQNEELTAQREKLENQRGHYQMLFDFAPDGYLVTNTDGIIQEVNQAMVKLLGIPKDQLLNKPMVLYLDQNELDNFHLHLDQITQQKKDINKNIEWEARLKPRNGHTFSAALTVGTIRSAQGATSGLLWLVHNLTESKRAARREILLTKTQAQHREAKESNRLLHALIETMPIGVIIADSDGNIAVVNTAGREILGSSLSGPLASPKHSFTAYSPDGRPLADQDMPLAYVMREGKPIDNIEFILIRKDGETRSVLSSAAPILNDAKQVVSGIAVFQDITDRKRSRQALREYANRLQVLRSANDAILTAGSLDELVETVLPYTHQLLPCQLTSLVVFDTSQGMGVVYESHADNQTQVQKWKPISIDEQRHLADLSHGELQITKDISNLVYKPPMLKSLQEKGIRSVVTAPLISKHHLLGTLNLGFIEPIDLTSDQLDIVIQIAGKLAIGLLQIRQRGELQHYANNLEQIVEQRTGDLRASEERFRTILNASPFGIALLDTEGKIVAANPAFQTMTGYDLQELTGVSFSQFIDLSDKKADRDIYFGLVAGTLTKYQGESRYQDPGGKVHWHQVTISPVKQAASTKPWLAVATMEDITEKKKVQETLARTERLTMAGRLGASLAHEINNPLQSVIGCLGLVDEMLENNDDVKQYLEIAMQELERTADIVSQLRDLSREPALLTKRPTNLNEVIERTLLLTRKRCQNQSIDVKWIPAEDLPLIPVAQDRIQQVLLNLILNSIEAMEGGGKLEIFTERTTEPDGVRIKIADNGIGIAYDRLPTLFEPFNSNRAEGLGLGLFISRRIINDEHGGHIDVESRDGEGSIFTINLPY